MGLELLSEFCTPASVEHGEPMLGTAAGSTSVWLGIEVRGAWPHDAMMSEEVPPPLREALTRWKAEVPGFRPQAVRKPGRCSGPSSVFLATSDGDAPALAHLEVATLEEVAALDLPMLVSELRRGGMPSPWARVDRPTVWVCTHGKRDRCCAKWGVPVFEALAARSGVETWQTSHLGGHRFAATALSLPHGLCFGRLSVTDVPALAAGLAAGEIFAFDKLRGRTCWSAPAQAAAHFVRVARTERRADAVRIESETPTADGATVRVQTQGHRFDVTVAKHQLGTKARPSCAKEPAPVAGWVLEQFAQV